MMIQTQIDDDRPLLLRKRNLTTEEKRKRLREYRKRKLAERYEGRRLFKRTETYLEVVSKILLENDLNPSDFVREHKFAAPKRDFKSDFA